MKLNRIYVASFILVMILYLTKHPLPRNTVMNVSKFLSKQKLNNDKSENFMRLVN